MTTKALQITVKASDQATGTLRTIGTSVIGVGQSAIKSEKDFQKFFGSMSRGLTSLKVLSTAVIGGLLAGKGIAAINQTAEMLDKLGKAAERYGISVQNLSQIKYAADLANLPFEPMLETLGTFQKNLGQYVYTGGGRAAEAIKLLGVNVRAANGGVREMAELLPDLADAFERLSDPAQKEFLAQKLFGGNGPDFVRLLSEGSARLRQYGEEARKLGAVFTPEQAANADAYGDALTRVQTAWMGLKARFLDTIGPDLTGVLNKTASLIAAGPEMAANLIRTIREAMGSGPGAQAASQALVKLLDSMTMMAVVGVKTGIKTVVLTILYGIPAALEVIGPELKAALARWFFQTATGAGSWAIEGIGKVLGAVYEQAILQVIGSSTISKGIAAGFKSQMMLVTKEVAAALRGAGIGFGDDVADFFGAGDPVGKLNASLSDAGKYTKDLVEVWSMARKELVAAGGDALQAADAILHFNQALLERGVGSLPDRPKLDAVDMQILQMFDDSTKWTEFKAGWADAFAEFKRGAEDAAAAGRELFVGVAGAATNNLGTALWGTITGTYKLKDVWRDAMRSMAEQTGQLISRMIALRIVNAGIGLFGGGASANALPSQYWTGADTQIAGFFANSGGLIGPRGVQRFGGGGMVGGPNVNRDVVPAMLTPGEGVLNPGAVRRNGAGMVHYMNRGGVVQPAMSGGGAGTVVIEQHNHFAAGATVSPRDLAALERASADGVLKALSTRPAYRESMRKELN